MAKNATKNPQKGTQQPASVLWFQIAEERRQAAEQAKQEAAKEKKQKK